MKQAINKCPICGGTPSIKLSLEASFGVQENGNFLMYAEINDFYQQVFKKTENLKEFRDCECSDCGAALQMDTTPSGEYQFTDMKDIEAAEEAAEEARKKEIEEKIRQWAKKNYPDGEYEIYAHYMDKLSDNSIREILEDENPMDCLYDKLEALYEAARISDENMIYNEAVEAVGFDADEDDFRDLVYELVPVNPPVNHFLDQEVQVDIFVDTGDSDYDFTCNAMWPHYNGKKEWLEDEDVIEDNYKHASLFWLAETQGYSREKFIQFLLNNTDDSTYKKKDFQDSVFQEIANMPSHMPALVFLREYTLRELIDIVEHKKSIYIDTNTMCGLYDKWSGGGSLLEIELEKPLDIPFEYIHQILPKNSYKYNIDKAYGMCGWAWNGKKAS